MDINNIIQNSSEDDIKQALSEFLHRYLTPAFGALPKSEVEIVVLDLLEKLGATSAEPEVYEYVSKLKVTRSKARGLIYDRELRKSSQGELDEKVKGLLKRPLIQKNGDLFVLEIENPLVSDHLRSRVKKLGYVSDGSFSPSIVKLSLDAITALIEDHLTPDERDQVKDALIEAGAPNTSFSGILKATLKKVASKLASDSGEALMDKASEFISPIVEAGIDRIAQQAGALFDDDDE